jgi:uncharacterized membrane protein
MNSEWQTFLLAMIPIGELRISIPIALTTYNLDWLSTYFFSVIGNLIPVALLLRFLGPISGWLSENSKIFQRFFSWLFERTRKKYNQSTEKYGCLALTIFVAIPFPFTGGWTGALIAFLFGIPFKLAFPLIALGVMTAGGIVLAITQAGIAIEKYFGWQALGLTILLIIFVYLMFKTFKKPKE